MIKIVYGFFEEFITRKELNKQIDNILGIGKVFFIKKLLKFRGIDRI